MINKLITDAYSSTRKINLNQLMQEVIVDETEQLQRKPKLLLHACCAVCTSIGIDILCRTTELTIFYYNPNIHPKIEYERRKIALEQFIKEYNKDNNTNVKLVSPNYQPLEFFEVAKSLKEEPEGGLRCNLCYKLRLEITANYAKENNFDYFATAITLSPMKRESIINKIGFEIGEKNQIKYLPTDFKKDNGNLEAKKICDYYNVYRQNYCGCVYARLAQGIKSKDIITSAKKIF